MSVSGVTQFCPGQSHQDLGSPWVLDVVGWPIHSAALPHVPDRNFSWGSLRWP